MTEKQEAIQQLIAKAVRLRSDKPWWQDVSIAFFHHSNDLILLDGKVDEVRTHPRVFRKFGVLVEQREIEAALREGSVYPRVLPNRGRSWCGGMI